jgi:hypothetical protein
MTAEHDPELVAAVADAARVVGAYWNALATDDDATLADICSILMLSPFDVGPGLAGEIRQGLSREACATMGFSSAVRIARIRGDSVLVFYCMDAWGPMGQPRVFVKPELVPVRRLAVVNREGRWLVHGTPTDPLDIIGEVDLPGPAGGPVQ